MEMESKYTVGDYLVERLEQLGLGHLFSIAGDYSIDWVNEYVRDKSRIKVIEEVNELNAGYAADGYARLRGIGALCVTYSAGALSAVNAIAGAYTERVPVVLINGTPSIKRTLTYEQTGFSSHHFISGRQTNLQVFEYITVAAVRLDNPALAALQIDYALTQCITQRCPVYIELLEDVVELPCEPPQGKLRACAFQSDPDSLKKSLAKLKDQLQAATNPLIWLGVEIDRFGLQEKARQLIRQLNIPYVTELLSKAVLSEDDPLFAGVFDGQASSEAVKKLASDSDFILALGVWLTDINTLGWSPADRRPDFDKTAFVSLETIKFGTYFIAQVSLAEFIDGLLDAKVTCKARNLPPKPASPAPKNLADSIDYQGFYEFIAENEYVCEHTIIGSDPSLNYFGSMLLKVGTQRGYIAQSSYSSIGYIAPAATGLCLAKQSDQRVVVFTGDGGFQVSPQCLSTQTRYGLNPIIFVINNGVYAVEQWLADAGVFSDPKKEFNPSCIMHSWNYTSLSQVFGDFCRGWKVGTYGELKQAIEKAVANTNGPSLIEVLVPKKSIPANATWKKN